MVKTLIVAKLRKECRVAFDVILFDIFSTFLLEGRTAHAEFKLPLDLYTNENPVCDWDGRSYKTMSLDCV